MINLYQEIGTMNAFVVIAVILLVLVYRKDLYQFLRIRWYLAKIPGPGVMSYPFIGHGTNLYNGNTPQALFRNISQAQAKLMKINQKLAITWLGPLPYLWVFHADTVEVLLKSSKHIEKSFVYQYLHPWLGTGLLTAKGGKWLQRRRLITPTFHFKILEDFLEIMNEQSQILIQKFLQLDEINTEVNIKNCITLCTLDIICKTAMGKSINAQHDKDSDYVKALYRISDIIVHRMYTPILWPDSIYYRCKNGIEESKVLAILQGFTQSVIREKIKSANADKKEIMAFLDVLLAARTDDGEKLSFSSIQEEVDTFMFAGHDTTTAATVWALYLLGRHPEIQRRVQEEVDDVMQHRDEIHVTTEDLLNLEYLGQVLKESLRILPSVPGFSRTLTEDCYIDGYRIPTGTHIQVLTYSIHHNPDTWEDPEIFDPDRFSKKRSVDRHPFAYIPFSAGPRNCIGQRFAIMEVKVLLCQILHKFNVHSATKREDLDLIGDLLLRSTENLNLTLKKRVN